MRGMQRKNGNRGQMASGTVIGTHRAGMHQKAEHEYQRGRMAEALPPEEETVEEGLEMPASVEEEIPPMEEEDDQIVEEIAEGDTEISAETEILEEISDPQAEIEEETAEINEELGMRNEKCSGSRADLAVDYSAERIPVLGPILSGGVDPSTPLEYTSQDGTVKEIQEPLPGMAEAYGVAPYVPNADQVISAPTEEIEIGIDPEGDLIVS